MLLWGKVECVEDGLHISFNTGRVTTLEGKGDLFGPFEAPKGFYIDGLRVKPVDDGTGKETWCFFAVNNVNTQRTRQDWFAQPDAGICGVISCHIDWWLFSVAFNCVILTIIVVSVMLFMHDVAFVYVSVYTVYTFVCDVDIVTSIFNQHNGANLLVMCYQDASKIRPGVFLRWILHAWIICVSWCYALRAADRTVGKQGKPIGIKGREE